MLEIRESRPDDLAALEALYPAAFPDEDLLPVLRALLEEGPAVTSLVGIDQGELVAHVAFTACRVTGSSAKVALLGPLAVAPTRHRQGLGTALVKAGLERLRQSSVASVFVLGDPGYYRRFGFEPDSRVTPPYPLPEGWQGAWRSLRLDGNPHSIHGELDVPEPWRQPTYWGA